MPLGLTSVDQFRAADDLADPCPDTKVRRDFGIGISLIAQVAAEDAPLRRRPVLPVARWASSALSFATADRQEAGPIVALPGAAKVGVAALGQACVDHLGPDPAQLAVRRIAGVTFAGAGPLGDF